MTYLRKRMDAYCLRDRFASRFSFCSNLALSVIVLTTIIRNCKLFITWKIGKYREITKSVKHVICTKKA